MLISVIRGALLTGVDDSEIKRWFGMPDFVPVSIKHRERWATAKAKKAYKAILAAWARGMAEPIRKPDGKPGGVRIGGIMRIGSFVPQSVNKHALDDYGNDLAAQGVAIYRRQTYPNGWYQYGFPASPSHRAQLRAEGYFEPWYLASSDRMYKGPIPAAQVPNIWGYGFEQFGRKSPVNDLTYCWAYRDPVTNEERRVKWRVDVDPAAGSVRLKVEVPNRFLFDLNGIDPELVP